MKKVIFSLAVIVLSAGAVVATTTSKAKPACTSCNVCHCPVCGGGCCSK